MKRFLALFFARNKEFVRDRSALGWNFVFPFLVVFGFAFMFSDQGQRIFKIGVVGTQAELARALPAIANLRYVEFVYFGDGGESAEFTSAERGRIAPSVINELESALGKVRRQRLDAVVQPGEPSRFWFNENSSKGYHLELVLKGAAGSTAFVGERVSGAALRYVDWLLPGLLAMNMMFSCLYGVGYNIVRYRKTGVLRRFKATPLSALEFLTAQVASRIILVVAVCVIIYVGSDVFLDFQMRGSYLSLILVFGLGAVSLICLSLVVAARSSSEEFANGVLNLIAWPMMFLSEVWFSLEGAHPGMRAAAEALPLTHINRAARAIMADGAGLWAVSGDLAVLALMSATFLLVGSFLFRWE